MVDVIPRVLLDKSVQRIQFGNGPRAPIELSTGLKVPPGDVESR